MPKIADSIKVKIEGTDGEGGKRSIQIKVEADSARFILPELLAAEGAIEPLEKRLKESCTKEVIAFLTAGKKALRSQKGEDETQSHRFFRKDTHPRKPRKLTNT